MLTAATSWMREKHMTIWIKAVSIHLHMYTIYAIEVSIPYIYICISIHFWVSPYVYYILYSQYIYIEVSWNGDTQKCMVYDGKTDLYMDDLRVPPFQEISIYVHVYIYDLQMYIFTICTYTIYTLACVFCYSMGISVLRDP
jgi:hypothetical protein